MAFLFIGAPGEIRTPDPLVRSQILYPTELRAQYAFKAVDFDRKIRFNQRRLAEREGFEPSMDFWPILP